MASVPTLTLNNGVEIPQLGLRRLPDQARGHRRGDAAALEIGYRHIDTARDVRQREGGRRGDPPLRASRARRSSSPRKLNNGFHARDDALRPSTAPWPALGFDSSTCSSSTGRCPASTSTTSRRWKAMEEIYASGRVRAIGVSNFKPHHLRRLFGETRDPPGGQPDRDPPLPGPGRRARVRRRPRDRHRGLVADRAGQGARRPGDRRGSPSGSAGRRRRSSLRWHVQRGDVVFPKSVNRSRIEENFALFDFELGEADMATITGARPRRAHRPRPGHFNYIPK